MRALVAAELGMSSARSRNASTGANMGAVVIRANPEAVSRWRASSMANFGTVIPMATSFIPIRQGPETPRRTSAESIRNAPIGYACPVQTVRTVALPLLPERKGSARRGRDHDGGRDDPRDAQRSRHAPQRSEGVPARLLQGHGGLDSPFYPTHTGRCEADLREDWAFFALASLAAADRETSAPKSPEITP